MLLILLWINFQFLLVYFSPVSARQMSASQAWFKVYKNTKLVNVTTTEIVGNITSSLHCLKTCKMRRTTGKFACAFVNYQRLSDTCELCDETGNIAYDNEWDQWVLQPTNDCSEIYKKGSYVSGIYNIYLAQVNKPVKVYCDMDTDGGGWTVFQRRVDGSVDFYLDWQHYKEGFGDLNGEFWLGNDNLHYITSSGGYELRVDMKDVWDITVYAKYSTFSVKNETDYYRLTVNDFDALSTAGDSLVATDDPANQMQFSTYDADHDRALGFHCAEYYHGAWWYSDCFQANLNGPYSRGDSSYGGVSWYTFRGYYHSLWFTEMKIRPSGFPNNRQ